MYLSRNKKYSNIISFLIFDRDIYIKIYSVSAKVCTKRIPILQLFYFTFFIIYNEEDFFLNYHSKFDERTSCKKRKKFHDDPSFDFSKHRNTDIRRRFFKLPFKT